MIQRIQTLFLAGVALVVGLLLAIPFAHEPLADGGIFSHSVLNGLNKGVSAYQTWAAVCLGLMAITLPFVVFVVLQFKNRKRQLGLINVLYLLLVGIAICVYTMTTTYALDAAEGATRALGFYLPVVGLLLAVLAGIFIRKDERLVKSLDRIR
ncbi:MAG: DUF4293 domain-containing protein [Flavobacteriales bacterium]